ncbi:glutathione synthase [Vibrio panuliri]|uniref:glutathione synthase n=1 Tax=Vibrio panuliri TaxID=1381081 RepID=A0ABX3F5T0_9VIBR|nr:glutathione synthase [Vibrio panuliri]KAB1458085.1 glutathione synthase [Vibrio panuliri]OLQ84939.1 glutathione synthase [Vibrio panuliri]
MKNTPDTLQQIKPLLSQQLIEDVSEWAMMHGVAFKQSDNTARHCPFSIAPTTLERHMYQHLLKVTPLIAKLISAVSEDHDFLQDSLQKMSQADPFFSLLMSMHHQLHGDKNARLPSVRQPLLLMRTDFMDDRELGAKVIEFNGIAAGMAPFGQRATQLHRYIEQQWPTQYQQWSVTSSATPADNFGMEQLALGIATAAKQVKQQFGDQGKPTFLMVVQPNEDNVYDQHLLEVALQNIGIRTVRRTFAQLSRQLSSGDNQRLVLEDVGAIDAVYLRAGYQHSDYCDAEIVEPQCCHTLSQTRVFIEQHYVAMNATISQQLATSKSMQMVLTMMPAEQYLRWGLTFEEAQQIKSVLAEMKPVNLANIEWFNRHADKHQWVLKNQGEGGGHCIFGDEISPKLAQLEQNEYDAWALMQRLYPHERETPTIAIRDAKQTIVTDLISEIGLFTAHYQGKPVTDFSGYAGYLIRSKPASENEGGIHSGKGILDSLMLVD